MFQGMGGGMTSLQMSARDVMSTGAGDVAGTLDKSFDPAGMASFYGGSINNGMINTNFIIVVGVVVFGYVLLKKKRKK